MKVGFVALLLLAGAAGADEALWQELRGGGHVLLIRHASTEAGTGDPPGFRVEDCSTQRNLSAAGRDEARRLGDAFRARAVPIAEVRSSPWCRCLETARLAFGTATPWAALGSLYNAPAGGEARTREVLAGVDRLQATGNIVLVTHNFNIRALTGISPSQAEVIVTRSDNGALRLLGRLPPP